MVDIDALNAAGLTKERLKAIFTAVPPNSPKQPKGKRSGKDQSVTPSTPFLDEANGSAGISDILAFPDNPEDWQIREHFERVFQEKLQEGMDRAATNYRLYAAADLAYESTPINKFVLPYLKLAQGYIDIKSCQNELSKLSKQWAEDLAAKDANGQLTGINMPRLFEISHNLVHSLVTRRTAAISTPITQRFPLFKYEARSATQIGKLRADLMSQRAEIMADQYGYRHDIPQSVREVSLYGHQVEFKASAWDCEKQKLKKRVLRDAASRVGKEKIEFEERTVREGVSWVAPHASRVYYDTTQALAKINSDTGPEYIGYWDLIQLGSIRRQKAYFNRDAIRYDTGIYDYVTNNQGYFNQYYRDKINAPTMPSGNAASLAAANDRKAKIADYAASNDRTSTTIAEHFEKIVPSEWGICNYPYPVWIRFVIAGNRTVIYAEPVGSSPAVCHHYNESDGREVSSSFAHAVIPYQDQISNFLTQLLEIQHQGFMRIYTLCTDGMDEKDIKKIESGLKNHDYHKSKDILIKYSMEKAQLMGQDPAIFRNKLSQVEIQTREKTSEIFGSIMQLLSLAERLLFFSQQELGQVAPREITATEATMVNNTTLGIRDFHGLGIDEALDAKKRIIFESMINFGSDEVYLPATERYADDVVKAAGFQIEQEEGITTKDATATFTLTGFKDALVHDFVFTSRDGFDRPLASEESKQLVTLLDVAARHPTLNQIVTTQQTVDIFSEVVRKISSIDLKLRVPEGMDPDAPIGGNAAKNEEMVQTLAQAVQQIAEQQKQDRSNVDSLAKAITDLSTLIQSVVVSPATQTVPTRKGEVAPGVPTGAPPLALPVR